MYLNVSSSLQFLVLLFTSRNIDAIPTELGTIELKIDEPKIDEPKINEPMIYEQLGKLIQKNQASFASSIYEEFKEVHGALSIVQQVTTSIKKDISDIAAVLI